MAKNEDRLDALEQKQVVAATEMANAAESLRDQKGAIERLVSSFQTLIVDVADTKSSISWLTRIIMLLAIPVLYSLYLQWSVHTKIGELDERTKEQTKGLAALRTDVTGIKEQKGADVKAVNAAIAALSAAKTDFEKAQAKAQQLDKTLRGPEHVMYITLAKDFAFDSSEGEAVLSWDFEIAGLARQQDAEDAVVIHLATAIAGPGQETAILPTSSISLKITDGRKLRVRMAMNSQEDKAQIEKFFNGGGTMAMDVAIYLAAK